MGNNEKNFTSRSPLAGVIPLVLFAVFFFLLYKLATGIFTILSWLAIPFIIIALVLDYNVVIDYFKYIFNQTKKNPIMGVGLGVLTVFGYPLVSAYLAFRAYMSKKIKDFKQGDQPKQEKYTEYEEVEEDDFLELEPLEEPEVINSTKGSENDYEDLFD